MQEPNILPPQPNAIATLIHLQNGSPMPPISQIQTLVFSIQKSIQAFRSAKYRKENPFYYPPDIVVFVSMKENENKEAEKKQLLDSIQSSLSAFTVRVVKIAPILYEGYDFSLLNLFQEASYNRILFLQSDCLVTKDPSSFLKFGNSATNGIIAASCHNEEPDKFGLTTILLKPSYDLHDKMVTCLNKEFKINDTSLPIIINDSLYPSACTEFLNFYYKTAHADAADDDELSTFPSKVLLESPNTRSNKDDTLETIPIFHFMDHPLPWEIIKTEKDSLTNNNNNNNNNTHLTKASRLWNSTYTNCKIYMERRDSRQREETMKRQKLKKTTTTTSSSLSSSLSASASASTGGNGTNSNAKAEAAKLAHKSISARYKELRKQGLSAKEAMIQSRKENEDGDDDKDQDPGSSVAAMFGLS